MSLKNIEVLRSNANPEGEKRAHYAATLPISCGAHLVPDSRRNCSRPSIDSDYYLVGTAIPRLSILLRKRPDDAVTAIRSPALRRNEFLGDTFEAGSERGIFTS